MQTDDQKQSIRSPVAHYGGRLLMLAALLGAGFFLGSSLYTVRSAEVTRAAEPLPVRVVEAVEQHSFVTTRKYAGRIASGQVSDLGFQLAGELVEVLVDEGDRVAAGAPLARLETTRAGEKIRQLEAQRAESASSLLQAAASLKRIQNLTGKGFANQQDLDERIAQRDGLRSRIAVIESSLRVAQRDLQDSTLLAPFSGQILQRFVDQGSVVQAGQPVLRLNQSGNLEARIGVPISARARLTQGSRFTLTAGGLQAEGVVTALVSAVNTSTRTVTAIFSIENDPGFIPSDLVRLDLDETARETGIWVPTHALNESLKGLWSVFVANPVDDAADDVRKVIRKDVEIIATRAEQAYVRGTLENGDRIIADSTQRFVPGQLVRIVDSDTITAEKSGTVQ